MTGPTLDEIRSAIDDCYKAFDRLSGLLVEANLKAYSDVWIDQCRRAIDELKKQAEHHPDVAAQELKRLGHI